MTGYIVIKMVGVKY